MKKAFTLVEILVAISVISILAVSSIVTLNNNRANSRDTKRLADVKQIQTALRMYYNDYKTYPTTAEWGTRLATGSNVYLEAIPQAPAVSEGACGTSSQAYIYESDGKTYSLKFCTGNKVGDFVAGLKEASPSGIIATSTPVTPPREPAWRVVANSSIPGTGSTTSRAWLSSAMSGDGQVILLSVYNGYMYKSTDGGNTFSELTSLGSAPTWHMAASSDGSKLAADNVRLVGSSYVGPILLSNDYGATWATSTGAGTRYWNGVAMSDDGTVVVGVVYKGYPFVSVDSGSTWNQRGNYGYYHGVDCSFDCSKMLALPSGSYPNVSTNTGLNWSQKSALGQKTWYANSVSNDGTKMVVGSTLHPSYPVTVLYVSTDSGANWVLREPVSGGQWIAGGYSGDGSKLVVANYDGYLYVSTDDGQTWVAQNDLGTRKWRSVKVSPDGKKIVAIVENGDIYIYD